MKKKVRTINLCLLGVVMAVAGIVDFRPLLAEKGVSIKDCMFEDVDPNGVIIIDRDRFSSLQFYDGKKEHALIDWSSGKVDVVGDPNGYTDAAKTFLKITCPQAAYEIVAHDPEMIRRLASEGHICKVLGHRWEMIPKLTTTDASFHMEYNLPCLPEGLGESGYVLYGVDDPFEGQFERRCSICGKTETRKLTEWK